MIFYSFFLIFYTCEREKNDNLIIVVDGVKLWLCFSLISVNY